MDPSSELSSNDQRLLEIELLRRQVEKLVLEVAALRSAGWWDRAIGRYLPILTALLAVAGFWFGFYQYYTGRNQAETERQDEIRREALRPFWDTQLSLYIRASEAAATLASSVDNDISQPAESVFWKLYWGPLACVEDATIQDGRHAAVEAAMVRFAKELKAPGTRDRQRLERLSLALAHAIRNEIGPSFNLKLAPLPENRDHD